jgi:hypothetical protein
MSQYPYPKHFLPNIARLGLVTISRNKIFEKYRYRVPGKGWVLGIFYPLARLQDVLDNDKNVLPWVLNNL